MPRIVTQPKSAAVLHTTAQDAFRRLLDSPRLQLMMAGEMMQRPNVSAIVANLPNNFISHDAFE